MVEPLTERESWRKGRFGEEGVLFDLRYKSLRYSGDMQMDMSSLQMVIRFRGWEVGGSGHNGL